MSNLPGSILNDTVLGQTVLRETVLNNTITNPHGAWTAPAPQARLPSSFSSPMPRFSPSYVTVEPRPGPIYAPSWRDNSAPAVKTAKSKSKGGWVATAVILSAIVGIGGIIGGEPEKKGATRTEHQSSIDQRPIDFRPAAGGVTTLNARPLHPKKALTHQHAKPAHKSGLPTVNYN